MSFINNTNSVVRLEYWASTDINYYNDSEHKWINKTIDECNTLYNILLEPNDTVKIPKNAKTTEFYVTEEDFSKIGKFDIRTKMIIMNMFGYQINKKLDNYEINKTN